MDFSKMYNYPYLDDTYFLDLLHLDRQRILKSKIVVLDWKERYMAEIEGLVIDGSLSIDANGPIRRTCSLNLIVNDTTVDITGLTGLVGLNRKIKIFVGMKNTVPGYEKKYGEDIWFPLGVFIMTQSSIRHDVNSNSLSLTVQDKMCLLDGSVGGTLQAPVDFAKYEQILDNGERETIYNNLYDIIRTSVIQYGQENPSKVIIKDLPLEVRKSLTYNSDEIIYVNPTDGTYSKTETVNSIKIQKGENFGFKMENFTVPSKELLKQAGESVTMVLDEIIQILGNYEYFYDIEGNFVFQEIQNYLNTQYKPYYQLENGDYVANFSDQGVFYSFVDKENISSYNNSPDWSNIKNDFLVWGVAESDQGINYPISYHVAIDDIPYPPQYKTDGTPIPWQQTILDLESNDLGLIKSPYYQELKAKWAQTEQNKVSNQWVYNKDKNEWNQNAPYYLDLIETNSDVGKYSVSNIGRRTKVIVDENVKLMYPPITKDLRVIYEDDYPGLIPIKKIVIDSNTGQETVVVEMVNNFLHQIENLKKQGIAFLKVMSTDTSLKSRLGGAKILKDAFSKIRELLFLHTTMNEVINISCIPLYFFDVNKKIEANDGDSNINGFYIVRSATIPLSTEGQMNITAIRATSRL